MATDPEFLAMRGIKRHLDSLKSAEEQQRVIDWAVSKVQSYGIVQNQPSPNLVSSEAVINPNGGVSNVPQGQNIPGQ